MLYWREILNWLNHIPAEICLPAQGSPRCAYLIALEGFRRGLKVEWLRDKELCREKLSVSGVESGGQLFGLAGFDRRHLFFRSRGDLVTKSAVQIGGSKSKTKEVLRAAGIRVPEGYTFPI